MELVLAIGLALVFALTNGAHDASNAIATLVATRGARPGQAITISAVFNLLGAVVIGTAVADTVAGIVTVSPDEAIAVISAGLAGASLWNLATLWRGIPSGSGHALVGGLVGAALAEGGVTAVNWGGLEHGWHPVGAFGFLIALAVSPVLGFVVGLLLLRLLIASLRRGTNRIASPVGKAGWVLAAGISFSHGTNDAQKTMGVIAAMLLADGRISELEVPLWTKVVTGAVLTLGTALGGWRIVRTLGRRIFPLRPIDSVASQSASTAVILGSSLIGAPVSTTHVVASSVIGVGGARRRWHHVRWEVVEEIAVAWLVTIPAAGLLAAALFVLWRWAS
ncbi:MAG: inorganic phosphate transporter [Gaiellales bacterium]